MISANIDHSRQHKILDVGIGTGALSALFRIKASIDTIYGIDASKKMLDVCADKRRADKLFTGDVIRDGMPEFKDGHFDVVMSSGLFDFARYPGKLIAEMARVTQPGGVIAFTVYTDREDLYQGQSIPKSALLMYAHDRPAILRHLQNQGIALMAEDRFVAYENTDHRYNYDAYVGRKTKEGLKPR